MTLSAELDAAADACRLLEAQMQRSAERHDEAAALLGAAGEQLPAVWVSPESEYLEPQLVHLRSVVTLVAGTLEQLASSLAALGATAASLAIEARSWEQKLQEARAELDRRSFMDQVGDTLFGGPDAQWLAMQAQAALDAIRDQWNSACRAREGVVVAAAAALDALAQTSVLLRGWDATPSAGPVYEQRVAMLYLQLRGDLPSGFGNSNWLGAGGRAWMWWQDFPLHTSWDWVSYVAWIRSGADMSRFPTVANGFLATRVAPRILPGLTPVLRSPLVAGASRLFPLAGGIYTAGTAGWRVVNSGLPHDALRERGAGYTSDIGLAMFGTGVIGVVLVGTTPLWGGLAAGAIVVGGAIWIGSEVVRHWDTISGGVVTGWNWTTDAVGWAWNQGTAGAGWLYDQGTAGAEWAWNQGTAGAGWLYDQGTAGAEWVWDQGTSGASWLYDQGIDLVGDVWDGGTNLAGDIWDAGGSVLSGAGGLAESGWNSTLGRLF